jgi:hypothetical protein
MDEFLVRFPFLRIEITHDGGSVEEFISPISTGYAKTTLEA